jgi:hypothetical protein
MIVPFITFVIGGGIGFAAGQATKSKAAQAELAELRRRLELAQSRGTPVPALLPDEEYREPDTSAVINLPIDKEDFRQLHQAMCECAAALREEQGPEGVVTSDALRDCLLEAVYPDFTWPPVPGDPSTAQLMWLVADHEARKTLADPSACPPRLQGEIVPGEPAYPTPTFQSGESG